jgi:AcrB/AcrD/AcrF family
VPLMISHGAGAEMRKTLGTAVFSGMLGVTLFGIFMTPVFYFNINRISESPWLNTPFMRRLIAVVTFFAFGWITYGFRQIGKASRLKSDDVARPT